VKWVLRLQRLNAVLVIQKAHKLVEFPGLSSYDDAEIFSQLRLQTVLLSESKSAGPHARSCPGRRRGVLAMLAANLEVQVEPTALRFFHEKEG
jgi:hypothetical protein